MALPDIRCTIYNPTKTTVFALDASGDVGKGDFKYSDSPDGSNAAATIPLALRYEDIGARGYWTEWNIVEISSGDNVLVRNAPILSAGSTQKYYIDSIWGFDTRIWMDDQIAYFWDGNNLTQRCPVSAIGYDNAPTIVNEASAHGMGSSLAVTIPAATAGNTLVAFASVGSTSVSPGSGWTSLGTVVNGGVLLAAFSKVASGGETSVTFTPSTGGNISATVLEIAHAGAIAQAIDGSQTGALLWSPPITSPGVGALALTAFSTVTGAGTSTPRGWSSVGSSPTASTTLTEAITPASTLQTITVASGSSFAQGEPALVGTGADQEYVTLTATASGSIQGVFTKPHASGEPVVATAVTSNPLAVFSAPCTDTSSIAAAVGFGGTPSTPAAGVSLAITIGVPMGLTPAGWILCGTSLNGGGTPAYLTTQTIVGRRRYSGVVQRRVRPNEKAPGGTITCTGMSEYLNRAVGNVAYTQAQNVDIGTAIFSALNLFATQWPFFTIDQRNFPTIGQTYDGTFTASQVSSPLSSMLKSIASGDGWFIRIGHDFTPRLIPLYRDSNDSYVANLTLQQNTPPQAVAVSVTDSDVTAMYNRILVTGDTDPVSGVAVSAEVVDEASYAFYGLYFDGAPVQVQGLKTTAQCANYGRSLLDQNSLAKSSQVLSVYTRYNPGAGVTLPGGMLQGDVVPPCARIIATGFVPSASGVTPPDIDGLVSVVVTTIKCDNTSATDSLQTANFAAMMPDWKAELAERANAVANAFATNAPAAAGIDQYFVDASAYPPTIAGFTVTLPSFKAVFAQGTAPVTVGGISYTVQPNTTSRAWLLPNNTIQLVTDGSIVSGAIPYLFQQSNSAGITGTIDTAQVGLLDIPAYYMVEGQLLTPTVTGPGGTGSPVLSVSGPGQYVSQITITVECTDQPTDGSLIRACLFYRQLGQPTWLDLAESAPRNATAGADGQGALLMGGALSANGLYVFIYPEAANGPDFEFGFALMSNRGTQTPVVSLGNTQVLLGVPTHAAITLTAFEASTALATAITATGSQTAQCTSGTGLAYTSTLIIDTGANQETVTPSAVDVVYGTFVATFTKTHAAGAAVVSGGAAAGSTATIVNTNTPTQFVTFKLNFTITGATNANWLQQFNVLVGYIDPANPTALPTAAIVPAGTSPSLSGTLMVPSVTLFETFSTAPKWVYYVAIQLLARDGSFVTSNLIGWNAQ